MLAKLIGVHGFEVSELTTGCDVDDLAQFIVCAGKIFLTFH